MAMFATTAQADRVLFTETFESGELSDMWTLSAARGTLSIISDAEGKYLTWALGQNNGTSAAAFWGESIFDAAKEGLEEYSVSVDFQIQAGDNQFNGEFAIYSGEGCASKGGQGNSLAGENNGQWLPYSALTPNCLFGLAQNSSSEEGADHTQWFINGDESQVFVPEAGIWYTVVLNVNTTSREVTYTIDDLDGNYHKTGTKQLAEDASVYASGLFLMDARYQSVTNVDNILVTIPGEFANDPTIALTGLNLAERYYAISFMEGETLHVVLPDGTEQTVAYNDCDGRYPITVTTSGTLKAYTTAGSLTSNVIEKEVNCEAIVLPAPVAKTVAASEGYGKTVKFDVDKTTIEMMPDIFFDFSFKADNGTDDFVLENQTNGSSVEMPSKGSLTITTKAEGYTASTTTYENNVEYKLNLEKSVNFAHLTADELAAVGYNADGNVTGNFANYGRLFCVTEAGDTLVYNEIPQYTKLSSTFEDGTFYPNLYYIGTADLGAVFAEKNNTVVPVNVHIWQGVGLNFEGRKGDTADGDWIKYAYFMIDNMEESDFAAVYIGGNYGNSDNDSNHPVVSSLDEVKTTVNLIENRIDGYQAGVPVSINRVSDAIGRIDIYSAVGASGISTVNNKVYTASAPVYNLNGVRISGALKKGVYIKQGKKFVVK